VSLVPPETVWKLQKTLHAKAKESPDYRFYALYDKVYRRDVLEHAYRCCRANAGAPGVDEQSFADIESYGLDRWLDELTEELRSESYRADAVRRVFIPKSDGKQRPLGIPSVKTRVGQLRTGSAPLGNVVDMRLSGSRVPTRFT
jgi:retron-type reverse transcriptase